MKKNYINGLIIIVLSVGIVMLFWTASTTIDKIREDQRKKLELWKKSVKAIVHSENPVEISFIFDEIISGIDFPVILTSQEGDPITYKNVDLSDARTKEDTTQLLKATVLEMDKNYGPIRIEMGSFMLQYLHYGDSIHISRLRTAPVIMIVSGLVYLITVYWVFSNVRKREQDKLWVGIAKETAHQLGTPISALIGWVELLKMSSGELSQERRDMLASEMKEDIERLNLVATRFSKIGAKEPTSPQNIHQLISTVLAYYERRLPHLGKKVTLSLEGRHDLTANANKELLTWVLENLIKNALDVMDKQNGQINVYIEETRKRVAIRVKDNGKGILPKNRKKIFRPGFSTKTKGWGLGLALVKRIIEQNHNGSVRVKETEVGVGTTVEILLPKAKSL